MSVKKNYMMLAMSAAMMMAAGSGGSLFTRKRASASDTEKEIRKVCDYLHITELELAKRVLNGEKELLSKKAANYLILAYKDAVKKAEL